jgi:hypothetical protein
MLAGNHSGTTHGAILPQVPGKCNATWMAGAEIAAGHTCIRRCLAPVAEVTRQETG